jgi:hypothetical protein
LFAARLNYRIHLITPKLVYTHTGEL